MSQNSLTFQADYKNQSTLESTDNFDQSILSTKFRFSQFLCLEEPHNNNKKLC